MPQSKERKREYMREYMRKKKEEGKTEETIQKEGLEPKSLMCQRIAEKLCTEGTYWTWLEGDNNLTREEKYHIANCDFCSRLWSEKHGSGKGEPNLWRAPKQEKTKEELESEAKTKLKEDFPDYT